MLAFNWRLHTERKGANGEKMDLSMGDGFDLWVRVIV